MRIWLHLKRNDFAFDSVLLLYFLWRCICPTDCGEWATREKHLNKFTGIGQTEIKRNGTSDDQLKLFLCSFLIKSSVFLSPKTEERTCARAIVNTFYSHRFPFQSGRTLFQNCVPIPMLHAVCWLMNAVELSKWMCRDRFARFGWLRYGFSAFPWNRDFYEMTGNKLEQMKS